LRNFNYTVVGGAGFIGSHTVRHLLSDAATESVQIIDNFSSGTYGHIEDVLLDSRCSLIEFTLSEDRALHQFLREGETVIHYASNPDIARAATDPTIDFFQGTALTNEVCEASRLAKVKTVLYASGSGVYGDHGDVEMNEFNTALVPISTYGASKLAGETLLRAYSYMFGLHVVAFRFGNVVGPMQTHGVGYDFVNQLHKNKARLSVLGDGRQSKTYIEVSDVINAILIAEEKTTEDFSVFNVGTDDYISVSEIADLAVSICASPENTEISYAGGDRGWKGDVPVMRLDTQRIRALGWRNKYSTYEAMRHSMTSMFDSKK
jgi:UDP-glucose 4-epimerase